jgi:hypothetical protein
MPGVRGVEGVVVLVAATKSLFGFSRRVYKRRFRSTRRCYWCSIFVVVVFRPSVSVLAMGTFGVEMGYRRFIC